MTTDDTGSIDETVASSATEATEIDGTTVSTTEPTTPAGAENTETAPQEHMIPKSRLDEVIGQKRAMEDQLIAAKAKLEALEPKETAPAEPAKAEEPPVGMDQHQQLRWYVERYSNDMIEKKLGMSLEDASQALSGARKTGQDYASRRWAQECEKHSIDPNSEEAAKMVTALVHAETPLDEAFSTAAKLYGKPQETQAVTQTASVETAGISPVMAREGRIAKNKDEATEMATKGQSVKRQSSQEIIDARNEVMKKASSGGHLRRLD